MKKCKQIKIESSTDEMYRVEKFVEEISDEYLLYGNYFGNILMAVTEAVENAMIHGNGLDRRKFVRITHESTKEGLWVSVLDEGKGFDHNAYSSRMGIEKDFGMEKTGLLLIHTLADEVRFNNEGRSIDMLFRINGVENDVLERRMTLMQAFFRVYQHLNI